METIERERVGVEPRFRLTVAFTPVELEALNKIAKYQNRSRSSAIRNMVIECWKVMRKEIEG